MEEHLRFMIFRENMKRIDDHNKKASEGKYSYYLKMYSHGDMLNEEFSLLMNGFRVDLKQVMIQFDNNDTIFPHETTYMP